MTVRGIVSVTYNGPGDQAIRRVSLNAGPVRRLLGLRPGSKEVKHIIVNLGWVATGKKLLSCIAPHNEGGRYYMGSAGPLPEPYPLRDKTSYFAEIEPFRLSAVVGPDDVKRAYEMVEDEDNEWTAAEDVVECAVEELGSEFCYLCLCFDGRLKYGQTNHLIHTRRRHTSDAMRPCIFTDVWRLQHSARQKRFATDVESKTRNHFGDRLLEPRREWLASGTEPLRVAYFMDEVMRGCADKLSDLEVMTFNKMDRA